MAMFFQKNLELFKGNPVSPEWKAYVDYIDEMVIDGFFNSIESSLKFFLDNTGMFLLTQTQITDVQIVLNDSVFERCCLFLLPPDQRAGLAPLFEAQLDLHPPDMIFRPSLEFGAVDGFYDLVEGLVNDVYRIASLVPRLAEHSAFPHYQVCASCLQCSARAQSDRAGHFFVLECTHLSLMAWRSGI